MNMLELQRRQRILHFRIGRYLSLITRNSSVEPRRHGLKYVRLLAEAHALLDIERPRSTESVVENKPPTLTKAEGRALYFVANDRGMLDPDGDSAVLTRLREKGCIDRWTNITCAGQKALSAFKGAASKGDTS